MVKIGLNYQVVYFQKAVKKRHECNAKRVNMTRALHAATYVVEISCNFFYDCTHYASDKHMYTDDDYDNNDYDG